MTTHNDETDEHPATPANAETGEHPPTPTNGDQTISIPPWVQLVGLPLLVVIALLFAKASSHAVVVFFIALIISLLLSPIVRVLVRIGLPRLVSVLIVFGMFLTGLVMITLLAVNLIAGQAVGVKKSTSEFTAQAVTQLNKTQEFFDQRGWNIDLRSEGVRAVESLQARSVQLSGRALEIGGELFAILAAWAFNLVLIIVISVYMLLDAPRIGRFIASFFPKRAGIETFYARLEKSLLRYAIGQTLASIIMGASAALGLYILGVTGVWDAGKEYAILFGIFVGVTEFAPSIGPVIGSIPPIVLAMFDGIGPAIIVTVFFILLHQIEGHIVVPKLMGAAIAVHPLLVIFGILAGAQIMGIGGILLALPLLAILRETMLFVTERTRIAAWPRPEYAFGLGSGKNKPVEETGSVDHEI